MVYLTLDRQGFPKGQQVAIAPHGTWSFPISSMPAVITTGDPVMVSILETIGSHAAAITPEGTASTALILPAIDIGRDGYAVSQIELTNAGAEPVQATLNLTDGSGKTLWSDKIWVEANGTTSKPFWYKGDDSRFLSIQARTPLTATLLQREIRTERPVHGLGLSLALVPGYAAGGYGGVLVTVALLAALVVLALYELLRRIGLDARIAVGVAALIACSSPLSPAAVRLYAEVGGTLFLLLALLCLDNWRIGRWSLLLTLPLTLLCLAGTALFHTRLLPAVLVIAGMGVLLGLTPTPPAHWRFLLATVGLVRRWCGYRRRFVGCCCHSGDALRTTPATELPAQFSVPSLLGTAIVRDPLRSRFWAIPGSTRAVAGGWWICLACTTSAISRLDGSTGGDRAIPRRRGPRWGLGDLGAARSVYLPCGAILGVGLRRSLAVGLCTANAPHRGSSRCCRPSGHGILLVAAAWRCTMASATRIRTGLPTVLCRRYSG